MFPFLEFCILTFRMATTVKLIGLILQGKKEILQRICTCCPSCCTCVVTLQFPLLGFFLCKTYYWCSFCHSVYLLIFSLFQQ